MKKIPFRSLIPLVVSFALFMESVDTTIINTAIPAMAHSFNVSPIDLKIALISYLLSVAMFIPISGWVADKFGIKRVFMTALVVFTLSSAACGYASTLLQLVIARTLQGVGGSFMLPLGRLVLVRTFERHELINVMSRVIMVSALGVMLGPVLGGFITHYISWHWIFWVNIPVGCLTLLMTFIWFEDIKPQVMPPLDKLGFIYFGTGLACLTLGLSAMSEAGVSLSVALNIIFVALVALTLYLFHSRKAKHPIVNPELFRYHTFRISVIGNLLSRLGFGGVSFLLPLLLQVSLGYSAQVSGMLIAPIAIGIILIKPFSLSIIRFFGYKRMLLLNTLLVSLILWVYTFINQQTPVYSIAFLTFLFGFLIALQYSSMNSLAYAEISSHHLSAATSIMSTMQQLAQSFGVAVSAMLIRLFTPATGLLPASVFHHTFAAMALITLFSMFIFMHLKKDDGEQMTKKLASRATPLS